MSSDFNQAAYAAALRKTYSAAQSAWDRAMLAEHAQAAFDMMAAVAAGAVAALEAQAIPVVFGVWSPQDKTWEHITPFEAEAHEHIQSLLNLVQSDDDMRLSVDAVRSMEVRPLFGSAQIQSIPPGYRIVPINHPVAGQPGAMLAMDSLTPADWWRALLDALPEQPA